MARNTNIKLRRSATAGAIPTTSNLDLGELALNTYDGKLYAKTTEGSASEVIQVGSSTDSYHKVRKSQTLSFEVKVASKTSDHVWYNSGSGSGYYIDGLQSPHLHLVPGNSYKFDQSDSSNSGHPLRFYYDAAKTTAYTTGVTTNGTPGSSGAYTQIIPTDDTPIVLHYQCTAHGYMGGRADFSTRNLTGFDTDDLGEGSSNLYFTNARARAAVSAGTGISYNSSTGVITNTITQYSNSDVDSHLNQSNPTSGYVLSWNGSDYAWVDNAGFTTANARTSISVTDSGGDGSLAYNNSTGVITYTGPSAAEVRAHLSAGTGVTYSGGAISIGQAVGTSSNVSFGTISGTVITGSTSIKTPLIEYTDGDDAITIANGGHITTGGNLTVSGNLTTTGYIAGPATFTIDPAAVGDNTGTVVIAGNLQVDGTTTSVNSTTLEVADLNIVVGKNATSSSAANGAGITFGAWSSGTIPTFTWNHANQRLVANYPIQANLVGNVTGTVSSISNHNIGDLSNVATTSPSSGQVLKWNGSAWAPSADLSGAANQNLFETVAVSGQSDIVADSVTDTLTFAAGNNITLTTNAGTDTLTIAASGGEVTVQDEGSALSTAATTLNFVGSGVTATGSGATKTITIAGTGSVSEAFKTIAVSGQSDVVADLATDTLTLAAGSGMTLTTNATSDTITFASTGSSSQSAIYKEYVYNPSSTVATFTGSDANGSTLSYTVGYIKVYLNGILLKPTTDYTATNGTSVVLVNAAGSGDCIQISTFVQLVGTGDSSLSELSGNGSTTAFTIAADPNHENNTQVYIDGVYQEKATYSISGTTLTFSAAPPNGSSIEVVIGSRNVTVDDVEGLTVSNGLTVSSGITTDTLTASGAASITGNLDIASSLRHIGDTDTELKFTGNNELALKAGGANHFTASSDQTTRLYGGNTTAIVINSSQKVGIGSAAPTVSLDVGTKTDAIRVPNGTTAQRPAAATGQLRYNTTTSEFEGYANSAWGKIGGGDSFGTIAVSGQSNVVADQENDTLTFVAGTGIALTTSASGDSITVTNSATGDNAFGNVAVSGQTTIAADSTNDTLTIVGAGGITATTTAGTDTLTLTGQTSVNPFTTDFFTTANASTTAFTLSVTPPSEDNLIVFLEGVYQNKNSYALSGTTLTLDAAPASGQEVVVHIIQNGVVGAGHVVDEFTGNGSTAAYTLSVAPLNENNTFVYLDGVYQEKSTYTVSGTTLTFDTNVTSGHSIEVVTPQVSEINQPAAGSIDNVNMFSGIQASEITSTTVASTSATTIATHAAATYRSVKYNVQITQGSNYHTTEINVLHNGTTAYITEYGTIFSGSSLATFDATISSGNLLLQITMGSANSATIKVVSTAIPV